MKRKSAVKKPSKKARRVARQKNVVDSPSNERHKEDFERLLDDAVLGIQNKTGA